MRTLTLEIADTKGKCVKFQVQVDYLNKTIEFGFANGATAKLSVSQWQALQADVAYSIFSRRVLLPIRFDPIKELLTSTAEILKEQSVRNIISNIDSTQAYHLFLAAFDLVDMLRFTSEDEEKILARAMVKDGAIRTRLASSNSFHLTLIPDDILPDVLDFTFDSVADELCYNSKIVRMQVTCGDRSVCRYYIPYITPLSSKMMGQSATDTWHACVEYNLRFG